MTDNRDQRGEPDRSLVNINEPYEAAYWTKTLGVSMEDLAQVVRKVGTSAAAVRQHLASRSTTK